VVLLSHILLARLPALQLHDSTSLLDGEAVQGGFY